MGKNPTASFLLLTVLVLFIGHSWTATLEGQLNSDDIVTLTEKIVPFVSTPQEIVEKMLEMAQVREGDVLYDLGSGDGRIVITAAKKYGIRAVGFEIDPKLVQRSRDSIREEGLEHLAEIRQQNIFTVDLSPASVLTLYLLPQVNLILRPNIQKQLRPGSRVVSHDFDMNGWSPHMVEQVKDSGGAYHMLYFWQIED